MKLSNVPTPILVHELLRRGFIDDFHTVRFSAEEIELVHPLSCRAKPDLALCEYGLVMMQEIEAKTQFPIRRMGSYHVKLEDGKFAYWGLV